MVVKQNLRAVFSSLKVGEKFVILHAVQWFSYMQSHATCQFYHDHLVMIKF